MSFAYLVIFLQLVNKTIKNFYLYPFSILALALTMSSCKVYRQNIILQSESDIKSENFKEEISKIEGAYKIQSGDRLNIEVYTNKGERVIDPNLELNAMTGGGGAAGGRMMPNKEFEVLPNGTAILPLLGKPKLKASLLLGYRKSLKKITLSTIFNHISGFVI